jgi:hypothetical protein
MAAAGWLLPPIPRGAMARKEQRQEESLAKIAEAAIEESRMVLPGIQALFGFQLIACFNQGFRELPLGEQRLHYAAIVLITLAIAMIMAPVAYHRIVEQGSVSRFFVQYISWMVAAAMVPLMVALCLDIYLIGTVILTERWAGAVMAGALLLVFAGLWFAFPFLMRQQERL